jgi:DNA-binding transcriptional ArsR family regulator
MKKNIKELADIFDILSNEVRLCILVNLTNNKEKNVTSLQNCAQASQSLVSQQLSKLKIMGIINANKIGNEVYYSIANKEIANIIKMFEISK